MKIFRLNDYDWWIAETQEQAIADYIKDVGLSEEETIDNPGELNEKQLNSYIFTDNEIANTPQRTFKEELQRRINAGATSEMFASTEY